MRPGQAADEVLEEQRRGDRRRSPGRVVGVGDLRGELGLVLPAQRHPPHRLTGPVARGVEQLGEGVVVGEQAAGVLAERDLDATGEGGDVDQHVGLELVDGVGESVGEDQPALGVGVGDLGGAAAVLGEHVAGSHRVAAHGVLGHRQQAGDPHRAVDVGQRRHHGRDHGGAGHVALHRDHRLAGLDRETAAVEGDALADQHDVLGLARRPWPGLYSSCTKRGGTAARLADTDDAAEAALGELLLVEDGGLEPGRLGRRDGLLGQPGGVLMLEGTLASKPRLPARHPRRRRRAAAAWTRSSSVAVRQSDDLADRPVLGAVLVHREAEGAQRGALRRTRPSPSSSADGGDRGGDRVRVRRTPGQGGAGTAQVGGGRRRRPRPSARASGTGVGQVGGAHDRELGDLAGLTGRRRWRRAPRAGRAEVVGQLGGTRAEDRTVLARQHRRRRRRRPRPAARGRRR